MVGCFKKSIRRLAILYVAGTYFFLVMVVLSEFGTSEDVYLTAGLASALITGTLATMFTLRHEEALAGGEVARAKEMKKRALVLAFGGPIILLVLSLIVAATR